MVKKIYKYIGPELLDVVFSREDYCGFKFSYPKNYNDPYELFLSLDFKNDKQIAAFYNEVVMEMPQYPTTCFSNSPCITPMWAHYANNSKGFVIEIDENALKNHVKDARLTDVRYQDEPRAELQSTLQMAMFRGKPRDIMFLRNGVLHSAYFTKQKCWSYELERRLVVSDKDVIDVNGNMVLYIPVECVTAIISGPMTTSDFINKAQELSGSISCDHFHLKIAKNTPSPYFLNDNDRTFYFNGNEIVVSANSCSNCKEPIKLDQDMCMWCSITEEDEQEAASSNPLRAFHEMGILQDYVRTFNSIGKK
jgi:hypothetical protein